MPSLLEDLGYVTEGAGRGVRLVSDVMTSAANRREQLKRSQREEDRLAIAERTEERTEEQYQEGEMAVPLSEWRDTFKVGGVADYAENIAGQMGRIDKSKPELPTIKRKDINEITRLLLGKDHLPVISGMRTDHWQKEIGITQKKLAELEEKGTDPKDAKVIRLQEQLVGQKGKLSLAVNQDAGLRKHLRGVAGREDVQAHELEKIRLQNLGKYTVPQRVDDLRSNYNVAIKNLQTLYGTTDALGRFMLRQDKPSREKYHAEIEKLNKKFNLQYKDITGEESTFFSKPPYDDWFKQAKIANPGWSDEDIKTEYTARYGEPE